MKLSILIPSLAHRAQSLSGLLSVLKSQYSGNDIEILTEIDDGEMSIGCKRNLLLGKATGDYLAFIDDDDMISNNYISLILKGISNNPDCCSLLGIITWDGMNAQIFEHSIKYKEYKTNDSNLGIKYERFPNHLNTIKSDIAKQFRFPEINHGEDTDWATQIFKSGLLSKEYYISSVIYHYQYKNK